MDSEASTRELTQQRTQVREAVSELIGAAESQLPATVSNPGGGYRGCESGGLEHFRNFRYDYNARLDAPGAERPFRDRLEQLLTETGFEHVEVVDVPGGQSVRGIRGELSAVFTERPDQGEFVLLTMSGRCVDVPKDDSDRWLSDRDEEPLPR